MNLSKTGKFFIIFALIFAVNTSVSASENWVKVTSKNFRLIGNADEKDIRRVALKLEQFRHAFTEVYDKMRFDSYVPTTVIVFKDEKSFRNFKPVQNGERKDWVAGFFQPGQDINYLALSLNARDERSYEIIFHEYTHFLINNTLGHSKIPTWLSEGLANYYERIEIKGNNQVRLGKINLRHLNLLQKKRLIPFKDFLKADYSLLEKQNEEEIKLFYAQSWAMIHYLIHGNNGARNVQLANFLDLLMNGRKSDEAFRTAFQTDFRTIENDLRIYVSQKSFQTSIVKLKNKTEFDREMFSEKISDAESQAFLGDLLFRMNRFDEAEVLLEKALRLDPELSFANISLGLVKMNKRDFASARKFLEKAISAEPENYSAHFNYALVLSREEMSENGIVSGFTAERAETMRRSLRKAISLNPFFAESYNLFAFIAVVQNEEIDEALDLLEKVLFIAPGNQLYILRMSELYLLKEDFEKSRTIAKDIFENAANEKLRESARNTLDKIEPYKQQIERSKRINETNPYLIKAGKTLTAKELEELHKKIEIDSINGNLRKLNKAEKRVIGQITKIECASKGVIYSVKSEDRELRFINKGFIDTVFFTYRVELKGGAIGCETDLKDYHSIITYKPSIEETDSKGEIVAVEFVPDYFVFIETKKENK